MDMLVDVQETNNVSFRRNQKTVHLEDTEPLDLVSLTVCVKKTIKK
jgi:hypothetical protein